jgi:hypothetical protein
MVFNATFNNISGISWQITKYIDTLLSVQLVVSCRNVALNSLFFTIDLQISPVCKLEFLTPTEIGPLG